ncbi:hypothetical protein [Streptomyces cinerochromogenes]|uniref:hypothetical protein n=1 Tax=Streptomyces cinerochromogenes TaxID=66422 RepID=UPI0016707BFC|nr:hypothetical protein [Streptomyces cinerochromogenes]GGS90867.1 hypothetical protein GCM10010206_61990 [Streptomyces cinerochromogenes]
MINKARINVRVRRLKTGRLSSLRARFHGRRDAAGLRELLRDTAAGRTPADTGLPPYVLGLHARVRRGSARLRSRTLAAHRDLYVRIQAESVRVVTQYTVRRDPAPAALARYGRSVAEWRSAAAVCRQQAQQLVDEANQLIACYWDAVWTRAQADGGGDGEAGGPPPGRLPGEITLDPTWANLDDSLLSDRWYAPQDVGRHADPSAVAQALHILDHQTVPGADATSGARGR